MMDNIKWWIEEKYNDFRYFWNNLETKKKIIGAVILAIIIVIIISSNG